MTTIKSVSALSAVGAIAATVSGAPWGVVNLHPADADNSHCYGIEGPRQVGSAHFAGFDHAGHWAGTASSFVSLNLDFHRHAEAYAMQGGRQVGFTDESGIGFARAALWSGVPATWVDLNPERSLFSWAYAIYGDQQGGVAHIDQVGVRASLWHGSADSWVDLTPEGAGDSIVYGIFEGRQVGVVLIDGGDKASFWSGSADSWFSLHPEGEAWQDSSCRAIYGEQQAGWAHERHDTRGDRAGIWHGSPDTWVNLHPYESRATDSRAYAVHEGWQAGYAVFEEVEQACVWASTPESWIDLHQFLPTSFEWSRATGIWNSGATVVAVGYGYNGDTGRIEAVMWRRCPADFNGDGQIDFFDYLDFVQAFSNEDPGADFNGDGQIDFFDYLDFVAAFDAGCD